MSIRQFIRSFIGPSPQPPNRKFRPEKEDEFKWLSDANIKTVLDIGAHAGESSQHLRSILPDARIFAFEPLPTPYSKLVSSMGGDPNFVGFQIAVGDCNEQIEMRESDFTQSSSLLPMAERHKSEFPFTAKSEARSVAVRRLDDLGIELEDDILIKIDVQGFEDRVIRGGENTIKRAKFIITEVSFTPLYEGQPLFGMIYDQLKQLGFAYGGEMHQLKSPRDGLPLQADALFVRHFAPPS
ncbi:FkbM family methyltransferase [Bradyrhizobium diazoefficiens]|uniref:FkbM family methyltransferase n=1 Tax=Bradyrhizobium diazoefficiens TaxID=1355477 RepID=UPI00190D4A8B|nr:FkbM family methyltransferase [Bradyrhizobium diazoefficiens]MBK3665342.1 FkbM family methyltransferase [Bradyrhizobium diazoefficiens]